MFVCKAKVYLSEAIFRHSDSWNASSKIQEVLINIFQSVLRHYSKNKCHSLYTVPLNVIILSVILMNVILLSVNGLVNSMKEEALKAQLDLLAQLRPLQH
jgi:hypothetical protein